MGVYYYFFNETTQEQNKNSCFDGLSFVAKLNSYNDELIENHFKEVIASNGWSNTDKIVANPDYPEYTIFCYENGKVTSYDESHEQQDEY